MMKTFLTLVFISILGGTCTQTAKSQQNDFKINIDNSTATVKAGDTATFNVTVTVPKDFDASVFLSVSSVVPQIKNSEISLSPSILNPPYKAKLIVTTTKNHSLTSSYKIVITATDNDKLKIDDSCYLNINSSNPTQDSKWHFLIQNQDFNTYIPSYITQDEAGKYWYPTRDVGFKRVSGSIYLEQWGSYEESIYNITFVPPIIDVKNNRIWIASYRDGLVRCNLEGKNKAIYNTVNSPIPEDRCMAAAYDTSKGTIWIGTRVGLAKFTGTEWTIFDSTNSVLGKEQITSIVITDSVVWIGTLNGLVKYDGTVWTRYTPENSAMPSAFVYKMTADNDGNLWMGLAPKGVNFNDQAEPNTMDGLAKFDGKNWSFFTNKSNPIFKSNYINSICIDSKGNKWISTGISGIIKYNDTSWTAFTKENSRLPDNSTRVQYIDKDDNIWFVCDWFWGVFNENGIPDYFTSVDEGKEKELHDRVSIFPNPSGTVVKIIGIEGNASIRVVNSLGVEVFSTNETNSKSEIDVSGMPSGLYFVSIRNDNRRTVVKPVVVSH